MIKFKKIVGAIVTAAIVLGSFGMADVGVCHAMSDGGDTAIATDSDATSYIDEEAVATEEAAVENESVTQSVSPDANIIYYVVFDGNGATDGDMARQKFTYGKKAKLVENEFYKEGYSFTGWNTKADGSGKTYEDNSAVKNLTDKNKGKVKLYAQWKKTKYKIVYNLDGGQNNSENPSYYYITSKRIILADPVKKGYTFEGWYKDKSLTKKVTRINSGSTGKKIFYAKWTPNKFYVRFNGNGSTDGSMKKISFTYGKYKKLPANSFTRKGYKFVGWNTKADGSGKSYTDGKNVRNLATVNGETKILYAQWKRVKYKIVYELDGGKNNSKNPSYYYITSKRITLAEPTKTGYTFNGWYRDKKLTKQAAKINSGSTGNRTFYAKWTPNKYYVKFDLNGSKSTAMKRKGYTYSKYYILPKCTYTRKGYKFNGWNTKADGSGKAYADGAKVKNLYSKHKGTRVLYAQWKPIRYTITYKLNGGKSATGAADHYYTNKAVTLKEPTRSGYTFAGWYKESTWKTKVTKISVGQTGNKTFYAKWTPNKFTYTFDGNGSTSGSMKTYTASVVGTTYDIANSKDYLNAIDVSSWQKNINWNSVKNKVDAVILRCGYGMDYTYQDDYEFVRNATECERLGIPYGVYLYSYATNDSRAKSEAAHILRLLKGRKVSLPVYLDCEEPGTEGYAARACEVIGNIIQNAGYMFGVYANTTWWNRYLPTVTGYTRWVAQYYNICQYGGKHDIWQYSSSGSVAGIIGNVDMNYMYTNFQQADVATYTLPENEYKRKGYTFTGWNSKADGSGKSYADEASIKASAKKNGQVTLYAQWTPTIYTISYVLDGGKNSSANPSNYTIESQTITLNAPKKTGYTFVGWFSDAAYKKAASGINSGSTGNKTFYAKWIGNVYSIRFDGNGCTSGSMADQSFRYGNNAKKLRANSYKRAGYDFAGWNTSANGKGTAIADTGLVGVGDDATAHLSKNQDAVVVLYAQWTVHEYKITYVLNGGTNNAKNPESYNVETSFKIYAPKREGYDFAGWYIDADLKTEFSTDTIADKPKNIKLYAKWESNVVEANEAAEENEVENNTSDTDILTEQETDK
ncbi:MAG: InlB B-repeat-containing protein [Lachnospiraceae bacterium]|nr:InlB B-repeat-containing protein [Lachnospiraceae bacterium]